MFVRKNYILNLRYHVPKNVLDESWLKPPGILENVRTPLGLMLQVTRALMELNFCYFFVLLLLLERAALAKHFLARLLHKKLNSSEFVISLREVQSHWKSVYTEHF